MKKMEENSVDAVVTDPPYGLAFMGKDWDDFEPKEFQEFCQEWGEQALRVLKPGGHLLAFCGTRTYHRMVVGLEDAGFEIRDQIAWMYGSGFPKGHDISKAIDKEMGKEDEREVVGVKEGHEEFADRDTDGHLTGKDGSSEGWRREWQEKDDADDYHKKTAPATEQAEKWQGWSTALKPSHEPVVVAQKPKEGTYAENVLEYGVGGLNIDACRINTDEELNFSQNWGFTEDKGWNQNSVPEKGGNSTQNDKGRWPGNVVLDQEAGALLDQQSSTSSGGKPQKRKRNTDTPVNITSGNRPEYQPYEDTLNGKSGASRFFYSSKAGKSERNAGLQNLDDKQYGAMSEHKDGSLKTGSGNERENQTKNDIATLKPINLMRWLTRLVTPEDGTVLDPFAGSGTTGCAAKIEGFNHILIEKRERFAEKIIPLRLEYWSNPSNWTELKDHNELEDSKSLKNGKLTEFSQ